MKIGIVGSGMIGGLLGTLWSRAGHEVLFSSRHPEALDGLVRTAGGTASAGTPDQAIAFADVVLLSIPFGALPGFGRTQREAIGRKILLDTSNPNIKRDGPMAEDVLGSGKGTGAYLREWFPDARVVRAFNTVWDRTLTKEAHRVAPQVGIPLASDDEEALHTASKLVADAGFDPVVVGKLDRAIEFDMGTPVYNTGMSGPEARKTLGVAPR